METTMHITRMAVTAVALAAGAAAHAETFLVNRADDDGGKHTLRWAINASNAINRADPNASGNRIVIAPAARGASLVIKPVGDFLPPLVGPVVVEGLWVRQPGSTPSVVIDGSNLVAPRTPSACPGATHVYDFDAGQWTISRIQGSGPNVRGYYGGGLAVHDSHDVDISGIEVRNFCFGIGTVRSHHVNVHDVRIVDHHGAAGVIFTGDDGNAGSTDLSHDNRLADSVMLDNGDGFEFTRGTHDSVIERNYIALTQDLPADGNALEFASSGNGNKVLDNVMTNYRITSMTVGSGSGHTIAGNDISKNLGPAVSFGGSGHDIHDNNFSDNGGTGVSLGGSNQRFVGNKVLRNGGIGVNVTSNNSIGNTISKNSIDGNGGLGIDLAPTGVNANDALDADTGPNGRQNHPVIDASSSWSQASGLVLQGTLASLPNQDFVVELFASAEVDPTGFGEGQVYLASVTVRTDAAGNATFQAAVADGSPLGPFVSHAYIAGTATAADGSTSEFGPARLLTRQ
jgi:3-dehydroshikimate dehydratase